MKTLLIGLSTLLTLSCFAGEDVVTKKYCTKQLNKLANQLSKNVVDKNIQALATAEYSLLCSLAEHNSTTIKDFESRESFSCVGLEYAQDVQNADEIIIVNVSSKKAILVGTKTDDQLFSANTVDDLDYGTSTTNVDGLFEIMRYNDSMGGNNFDIAEIKYLTNGQTENIRCLNTTNLFKQLEMKF